MDTTTDTKATRKRDPLMAVRDADERRMFKKMRALLGDQFEAVLQKLGDPPQARWLDDKFWFTEEGKMAVELRPELQRLALRVTEPQMIPAALTDIWSREEFNWEAVGWASSHAGELVSQITEATRKDIAKAVTLFTYTTGETVGELAGAIAPLRDTLGNTFGETRARRIAITETTRAYSQGMNIIQRKIGRAGINMEKVWQTANDEKVCPICGPNDGKPEREWTQVSGPPPAHPNCRCWVTLRIDERQRWAAADEQAAQIRQEFLERYDVPAQDDTAHFALERVLESQRRAMDEFWSNPDLPGAQERYDRKMEMLKKFEDTYRRNMKMDEVAARAGLRVEKPLTNTVNISDEITGRLRSDVEEGIEAWRSLVSDGVARNATFTVRPLGAADKRAFGRSYCSGTTVVLEKDRDPWVVVHELGHGIEHSNPAIADRIQEFYNRRTAFDPLTPLGGGYDSSEITRLDKFLDPYVGKDYNGSGHEVIAMGLQWLYQSPVWFAKNDPEHFDLMISIVRGLL